MYGGRAPRGSYTIKYVCMYVTSYETKIPGFLVGAPALTSRNFKEEDFVKVVQFIDRGVKIALEAQKSTGKNRLHVYAFGTFPSLSRRLLIISEEAFVKF